MTKFIFYFFLLIIGLTAKSFAQDKVSAVAVSSVNNSAISSFDVKMYKDFYPCPERCNFIKNGEFECISADIFINNNNIAPFYYNRVYGWKSGWGTPNINTGNGLIYNNSAYLKAEWNNGVFTSAGIYQNVSAILQPNVEYELSFSYKKPTVDSYNSSSNLHISLTDFTPVDPNNTSKPLFNGNEFIIDSLHVNFDGGIWHNVDSIFFSYNDTSIHKLVVYPDVINQGNTSKTTGEILIDKVIIKPRLKFNYPDETNICLGQTITITDTVPTVNIVKWAWSSTAGFGSLTKDITVTPNQNTIFTLTATDVNGCTYTRSIRVIVNQPTPVAFNLPNPIITCSGQTLTIAASVSGGATTSICHWSSNPSGVYSTSSSITVSPLVSTTYTVTTDANGCQTSGTFLVKIIPVVFNHPNPYTICLGQTVTLTASVDGSTTSNCLWTSVPIISYPDTTSITVTPTDSTVYKVVTDVGGCTATGIFYLNVVKPVNLPLKFTWEEECKSIANFSFDSITPNVNYIWHIPNGANIISSSGINNINVFWNYGGPDSVYVDGYDNFRGCHVFHGSIFLNPNSCVQNAIQLSSLSASQIINLFDTTYIITNFNPIIFNGTTTIDKNLIFASCPNIMFGTNARINVLPGVTLEFINCNIKQTCNCAWNGLYTENFFSKIILTNDTIRDAKNTVVSSNGGNYQITSVIFVNDSIGLYVHNYNPNWVYNFKGNKYAPASHPGFVLNSNFTKKTNLPGCFSNSHLTGIIVDTVYNLSIGDSAHSNYYSLLQWGVKIRKSLVLIENNNFDSIFYYNLNTPSYNGSEPNEAAIYCRKEIETTVQPSMPLINKVTIDKSLIKNSNTGIYAYHTQMNIIGSMTSQITHTGIHLKDFDSPSQIISNYIYQSSSNYDINNNLHNYNIIAEQSNTNANVILDISYNYIGDANGYDRSGILLRNCNGTIYGNSHCIIQDNIILYNTITPTTLYNYGISAFNCNYAKIFENTFQSGTIPDETYHKKIYGIYLNASKNAQVNNNQLIKMGDGVYVTGTSLGTQFFCNNFDNCWYGFYFNLATLSNQLLKHTASDNYWYDILPIDETSAFRRLSGNSISNNFINWYHRGATTDYNNMFSPYLVKTHPLFAYITPVPNIPTSSCHVVPQSKSLVSLNYEDNTDTLIASLTIREQLLGNIIKEREHFSNLDQENSYLSKEYAFKLIEVDPNYKDLGSSDDYIYKNFFSTSLNSNLGSFYLIGKYINDNDYSLARNLNSTLSGINSIENNRINVNRIYLNKVFNNDSFGTADSLTLIDIAYQSPLTGGDAVVSARVILGIDPIINEDIYQTKSNIEQQNTETPLTVKVYPNPANDKLYIALNESMDGITSIEIFDLTGKLIYSISTDSTLKLQTLNINNIKKGIYDLRISNNGKVYNQKLVII